VLLVFWIAWWYPFVFRAPHVQKRESITLATPTLIGLLLETAAFGIAFTFRLPEAEEPGVLRLLPAIVLGATAPAIGWYAVIHLGRQFRINAGLYHDHELVCTGPYALVRHPIYASLLGMLLTTSLLLTRWAWAAVALAVFIVGTEIRVRTEDRLLRSRFGEKFEEYRRNVPAYIPLIR
jgi:protein-S-isoprenylcysteine O-methyltransferase Ste14